MKHASILLFAGALGLAAPLHAHDEHTLDKMTTAQGGQLRAAGEFHFELVLVKDSKEVKPNVATLYVTDHAGNKVSTSGAKAKLLMICKRSGKHEIALSPDGENALKGLGSYASEGDLIAVASVMLPGKEPQQARFTPLAPR